LKISLDYDETYTRDPPLWNLFVNQAVKNGHDIRFVTFRSGDPAFDNSDIIGNSKALNIPIIFTSGKRKRVFCYEQGFMVDVWIDDMPEIIVEDYS
jgi:hypothetical protein